MALGSLISMIPALGNILNKIIPDPNERARVHAEITREMLNAEGEFYKAAGGIITAEAQGESWMQRNWRPLAMLVFVFIIANNYILVPYIQFTADLFGYTILVPTLAIPDGLWGLLQIGIGGYIASRGVEKSIKSVQSGGVPLIGSRQPTQLPPPSITREDLADDRQKLLEQLRSAG